MQSPCLIVFENRPTGPSLKVKKGSDVYGRRPLFIAFGLGLEDTKQDQDRENEREET